MQMIRSISLIIFLTSYAATKIHKICPTSAVNLSPQNKESLDLVIHLQDHSRPLFSNTILDKLEERFHVCERVNVTENGIGKRSMWFEYDKAEVFVKKNEVFVFYPVTKRMKKICPLTRYLSIVFTCPKYSHHGKAPSFIGNDECDLSFMRYESHVCFLDFTTEFNTNYYKTNSINDSLNWNTICIIFGIIAIILGIACLVLMFIYCLPERFKIWKAMKKDGQATDEEKSPDGGKETVTGADESVAKNEGNTKDENKEQDEEKKNEDDSLIQNKEKTDVVIDIPHQEAQRPASDVQGHDTSTLPKSVEGEKRLNETPLPLKSQQAGQETSLPNRPSMDEDPTLDRPVTGSSPKKTVTFSSPLVLEPPVVDNASTSNQTQIPDKEDSPAEQNIATNLASEPRLEPRRSTSEPPSTDENNTETTAPLVPLPTENADSTNLLPDRKSATEKYQTESVNSDVASSTKENISTK